MFKNEYTLNVDLKQKMSSVTPTFVQYDNATLVFRVFDNGKPFDLTGFTKAEVSHKQPDGHTIIGSATILKNSKNDDVISYSYLGSEMSKIGIVGTSLSLFSDDKKVSIQPFNVVIVSENRDSVVDVANPEYGLLQELIVDIELISLNANAQATHALIEGNYAKEQGDYAKATTDATVINVDKRVNVAISNINAVTEANKNVPLSPVTTFAAIATTYPNPVQGSKVQVTTGADAGKIYRREGTNWNYVEKMDSNMLSDIQTKINLGVIEVNATTPTSDVKLWLDIGTV